MSKEKFHPMIELMVACDMAGSALIRVSGVLQERHSQDLPATSLNLITIVRAATSMVAAIENFKKENEGEVSDESKEMI